MGSDCFNEFAISCSNILGFGVERTQNPRTGLVNEVFEYYGLRMEKLSYFCEVWSM